MKKSFKKIVFQKQRKNAYNLKGIRTDQNFSTIEN